ncbi:MAG: hypothetical protein FD181_3129 [Prolixibacteraceae bacterium]|nr:MAG: hypothetical protein FD181_3129 [Prolixibacteraceae bacterium]
MCRSGVLSFMNVRLSVRLGKVELPDTNMSYFIATVSISIKAPSGKSLTAKAERAGLFSG